MSINIEVSVGELLDKVAILKIKSERITDTDKLVNISKELNVLSNIWRSSKYSAYPIAAEIKELKRLNEKLWDIEDRIRDRERNERFDAEFIDLARSVYITNDKRAEVKKRINLATGSELVEEKSYQEY